MWIVVRTWSEGGSMNDSYIGPFPLHEMAEQWMSAHPSAFAESRVEYVTLPTGA